MVLALMLAGFLQAQDAVSPPPSAIATQAETVAVAAPVDDGASNGESRWFVRTGALGALYNSHARITTNGNVIPGSTARVTDNVTLMFDVGYDLSDHWALMLMAGIPPRPAVDGKGTVSSFGTLGAVRYGPIFFTGVYRFPEWRGFRPYAGAGGAYVHVFRNYNGAVTQLNVHDNWGFALQAGVEYRLNRSTELFVDYKRLWLDLSAEGRLANAPVRARVTLDPDVISTGVKFHFR